MAGATLSHNSWIHKYYKDVKENHTKFPNKVDANLASTEYQIKKLMASLKQTSNFRSTDVESDEKLLLSGFKRFYKLKEYILAIPRIRWKNKKKGNKRLKRKIQEIPVFEKYQLMLLRCYLSCSLCKVFRFDIWQRYQAKIEELVAIGIRHRSKLISITLRRQGKSAVITACVAAKLLAMLVDVPPGSKYTILIVPHKLTPSGNEFIEAVRTSLIGLKEYFGLDYLDIGIANSQKHTMKITDTRTGSISIAKWVSSDVDAARSVENDEVVVDEGAFVKAGMWKGGILPATMEDDKQMTAISTPNPKDQSVMDTLAEKAASDKHKFSIVDASLPSFCSHCQKLNLWETHNIMRCVHMASWISDRNNIENINYAKEAFTSEGDQKMMLAEYCGIFVRSLSSFFDIPSIDWLETEGIQNLIQPNLDLDRETNNVFFGDDMKLFISGDPSNGPGDASIVYALSYHTKSIHRLVILGGVTTSWRHTVHLKNAVIKSFDAIIKTFPFLKKYAKRIKFIVGVEGNMNGPSETIIAAVKYAGERHRILVVDPYTNEKHNGIWTGLTKHKMLDNLSTAFVDHSIIINRLTASPDGYIAPSVFIAKMIHQLRGFKTIEKISTSGTRTVKYSGKSEDGHEKDDIVAALWILLEAALRVYYTREKNGFINIV